MEIKNKLYILAFGLIFIFINLYIISKNNKYFRNNPSSKNYDIDDNGTVEIEDELDNGTFEIESELDNDTFEIKNELNDDTFEIENELDNGTFEIEDEITDSTVEFEDKLKNILINNVINDINIPRGFEVIKELRRNTEIHSFLWNSIFGRYNDKKYENNLENYKTAIMNYTSFLTKEKNNLDSLSNEIKLFISLHQSLYSWLYHFKYNSFGDLIKSFKGKGLVICVGDKYFNYARSTIDNLRNIIKSEIPIEIFYNGEDDLSEDRRKILKEYDNVYLSDLSKYFDKSILQLEKFAIKPFSVLASRFEEVILIDADTVYLRDPLKFFNDPGYLKKGTLFFEDRRFKESMFDSYKWFKKWITNPLPETKKLRIWNEKTTDQMESSTVVIHKSKTILGLLATCKLNELKYRPIVKDHIYGDKETFWLGFDMARQPYYFNPLRPVFIAKVDNINTNTTRFCGHIGHRSKDNKFMYWNGHLIKDKESDNPELIDFNTFVYDTDNVEWKDNLCGELPNKQFKKVNRPFNKYENKVFKSILNNEKKHHFVLQN